MIWRRPLVFWARCKNCVPPAGHEIAAAQTESNVSSARSATPKESRSLLGANKKYAGRKQEVCRAHHGSNRSGSPCPGVRWMGGLATKSGYIDPSPPTLQPPGHEFAAGQIESGVSHPAENTPAPQQVGPGSKLNVPEPNTQDQHQTHWVCAKSAWN